MTEKEVWFITGAARAMGTDFAKAALAAGHSVVAAGAILRSLLIRSVRLTTCWSSSSESVLADPTRHDRQIATAVH
jgi:NAD(P)-dependent dehydrogenase (short-subunit alcohol dehydrogenase family)